MQNWIFISHYSSLQCHMILHKSFKYADLLSMLETALNVYFITCDTFFRIFFIIKNVYKIKIKIFFLL